MKEHPFWFLHKREDLMNCCKNVDNLDSVEELPGNWLATCRKCGRRHRKMVAETGKVGATLQALG